MAFQEYALYPHLTVAENIGFPMRVGHVHEAIVERRIDEVANVLHLADVLDRRPSQLSGGQRQRVALGRAIVRRPRLLLMDEPMSNLDAKLRTQMRLVIMRLQRRLGLTTLYVTHDHDEAMAMGDRLAVMRAGRLEQCGVPIDVYDHPCNLFVAAVRRHADDERGGRLARRVARRRSSSAVGPHRIDDRRTAQLRARPPGGVSSGAMSRSGCGPSDIRPTPTDGSWGSVVSTEMVERRKLVTFDVDVRSVTTRRTARRRRSRHVAPPSSPPSTRTSRSAPGSRSVSPSTSTASTSSTSPPASPSTERHPAPDVSRVTGTATRLIATDPVWLHR